MSSLNAVGTGSDGNARFARNRNRTLDGSRYPSPFFDIAQTYLPPSVRSMFKWCRYYFFTHPIFNTVISKMAEYPITSISYDTKHEELKKRWKNVLEETLDILSFLICVGLDFYAYGNCFVSIIFPFKKYLKCVSCSQITPISAITYKFRDFQYIITCEKCMTTAAAMVIDRHIRSLKGIRLVRWGPENMGINQNDITGDTVYVYDMPIQTKNDIILGKPEIVERVPHEFIEALRVSKSIQFDNDNLFHLKRPQLAEQGEGFGLPLPFPSLKYAFYLQILQKSQEAIALEHIVPLRVLFPQPSSGTGNPYVSSDLSNWADRVETEIARWRVDQNHIPILPLPIGHQSIGGDGRALLLHQEIRLWSEQIISGMGVPLEFVYGGLSWSGSNVSLRMLENTFLNYRRQQIRLVRWILNKIALYMGWPSVPVHFTDFKMADDVQKKQLLVNLATMNKISDRTLLDEFDLDSVAERKQLDEQFRYDSEYQKRLLISQAEAQGEASLVTARYQAKAQAAMMQSPTPDMESQSVAGEQGVDARLVAKQYAEQMMTMPEAERQQVFAQIQQKYPSLAKLIAEAMGLAKQQGGEQNQQPKSQQQPQKKAPQLPAAAMKPLPASKPPRRQAAVI